jgi:hypothetical protein
VNRALVPILAETLQAYYDFGELIDVARLFEVHFEDEGYGPGRQEWLSAARQLVEKLEHGNHRAFLGTVIEQMDLRNSKAIATTTWERRDANEAMRPYINELRAAFERVGVPRELAIAKSKPFTAKSIVREFLEKAETEILVVDPYVGVGTLDCFRDLATPIRLLTGGHPSSVEPGFVEAMQTFLAEGFRLSVRRHPKLHDRHLVFNDRCWLLGSSLKDAGKKEFHAIEIVDAKHEVRAELEAKWKAASEYPSRTADS